MKKDNKKPKVKKKKQHTPQAIWNKVVIVFLAISLLIGLSGLSLLGYIIATTDGSDLLGQMVNKEPTTFYDADKKEIGENGLESRQNISYEQIPQSTIDAFLAIEDSRFFKHNGFDLPRFISSALTNLKSGSFAQGGSTLTMQAIDNFFMKSVEDAMHKEGKSFNSIEKVERKLQEIYMSMRLESQASKEEIIEKYLNQINFGDQARGIERGAQHFFGKSAQDLNLGESAYLAGCINAPNTYNPYRGYDSETKANYYKYATERRDDTLQMMKQHGFISETELSLAKSTKLAFQVVGANSTVADPYKSFRDAANDEAMAITKKDPATTPMRIYTTMDRVAQDEANKSASGEIVSLSDNTQYQVAFTVLDNKTGAIVAVCPGRSDVSEPVYKERFSDADRLPGSSIKPIIDYAYAIDKLGYCTSRVFNDKEMVVDGRKIQNADGRFYGKVSMERAIAQSLNMPAIQTLKDIVDTEGVDPIKQYLLDMGFTQDTVNDFNLLYSIGGTISVSPTQMAVAFASLANGGKSVTPHMITRIEFKDGKTPPIDVKPKSKQVLSPQAAYMTSDLLYKAVNGKNKGYNLMGLLGFGAYPVYGKTGTSDWADNGLPWGIPLMAMKDEWMINYTSEYTIATWSGFDTGGPGNYITDQLLYANIPGWINKNMLDTISKNPKMIANPGGISSFGGGMIKSEFLDKAATINPMTEANTESAIDVLQAVYDKVKDLVAADYETESFAAFQAILEEAKNMIDKDRSSEDEFHALATKLQGAADALVPIVKKNVLIDAINKAAGFSSSGYTTTSYENLKSVVDTAKVTLNKERVTQQEIDAQITLINDAISKLVGTVNRNALQATISAAQVKYDTLLDSDASKATLKAAMDSATVVLQKTTATQAEIDTATASLAAYLKA